MTEINDHKTFWKRSTMEIITYTEGSLADIIQLARKDILSLIITIERQKAVYEQLEERMEKRTSIAGKLQDEYDEERDKNLDLLGEINAQKNLIESQKEEIARHQEREFNHYPVEILELETRIFKLQDDAESQKAITELAVKALERISKHSVVYRYPIIAGMADTVLEEIERMGLAEGRQSTESAK